MSNPGIITVITHPRSKDIDEEAFNHECREAHKSRREFMQGGNVQILSHEHYVRANDDSTDPRPCMDVYEVDDIGPLLSGKVLLEEGGDGPLMTHTYTYKLLRYYSNAQALTA